jgi:hypothetical protein
LEEFLPLHRIRRRWTDRVQAIDLPLFPGYLFCRFGPEKFVHVMQTPRCADCGGFRRLDSNIGAYALWAADLVGPNGGVVAIEPEPSTVEGSSA